MARSDDWLWELLPHVPHQPDHCADLQEHTIPASHARERAEAGKEWSSVPKPTSHPAGHPGCLTHSGGSGKGKSLWLLPTALCCHALPDIPSLTAKTFPVRCSSACLKRKASYTLVQSSHLPIYMEPPTSLRSACVHPSPSTTIMCDQNHRVSGVKANIKQDSEDKRYHRPRLSQLRSSAR